MPNTLADNILTLMKKEGLNITELGNIAGIPKATLHKIVTGVSVKPRSRALQALAEYFKIPIPQLIQGELGNHIQQTKYVPIIEWDHIESWLNNSLTKEDVIQSTPTNLNTSDKSFALIFNETTSTVFRPGSILLFDPTLKVKDGVYILVKLAEHPNILLRQIICDVSNTKYLKSLHQEFSTHTKKLEPEDNIIAILVMAKTLFYYK